MTRSRCRDLSLLFVAAVWLAAIDRACCEEAQPLPFVKGSTTLVVLPDTDEKMKGGGIGFLRLLELGPIRSESGPSIQVRCLG